MRLGIARKIVECQEANGNKNAVYALGINENCMHAMRDKLYKKYRVWIIEPKMRDCYRVAGLELNTIYVDEESELDTFTMEYLLTRVRWPRGETGTPITKLTIDGVDTE